MTKELVKYFMNDSFPSLFPSDEFGRFVREFFNTSDISHDAFNFDFKGFPRVEAFVDDGKLVMEFLLAGYSKELLNVNIEDNKIIVSAAKCEDKGKSSFRARRAFTKSFIISKAYDIQKSNAEFENGILRVIVPPVENVAKISKSIEIK